MKIAKPAKHSKTSFFDQQAISYVSAWIAETKKAMPDLRSNDTWPNIDGYIELVTNDGFPNGKLEVQVKKLSNRNANIPRYSFKDKKFLTYCRDSLDWIPKILIGVNVNKQEAYWLHMDKAFVDGLGAGQTVTFDQSQIIKKGKSSFIDQWLKIVDQYRYKATEYEKYKNAYSIISETITPALGITDARFEEIHLFLNYFNGYLESEFKILKLRYYPSAWKIGLAYYEYSKTELAYTLYPISMTKNDIQIKEVTTSLHDKLRKEGLGFTAHSIENPIHMNPQKYARKIVGEKTLKLVENKLLNHTGIDFIATEFMFAIADKFRTQMGLEELAHYSIDELEIGFFKHLPLWTLEAYKILKKKNITFRRNYLDPDVLSFLNKQELDQINLVTTELIKSKSTIPNIPLGNEKLPFGIFVEVFNYLKKRTKEISRPYKRKDFTRLEGKVSWTWHVFSKKDADYNLNLFFKELPDVFNSLVQNNFPLLEKDISLFVKASTIVVLWTVKDEYQGYEIRPTYKMFYLVPENNSSPQIITELTSSETNLFSSLNFKKPEINFRGNKYKVISYSYGELDFIYSDTPMLDFVYKLLVDKFQNYFKENE